MFHFGDEDEEHEMPRVCKDGVRDANEGCGEVRAEDEGILGQWKVDPCTDHADDARHEDADD